MRVSVASVLWGMISIGGLGCGTERDPRRLAPSAGAGDGAAVTVGPSQTPGAGGDTGDGRLPLGPSRCPDVPAGSRVGEQVGEVLPDYALRHCDGREASFTELCGAEGLFIFAAQGWCSVCQGVSLELEAIQAEYRTEGLQTVLVLTEHNTAGAPPDSDLCRTWRTQSPHDEVVTLYDPTGTLESLWGGGSSQSAFVDRNRVIHSKLVGVGSLDELRVQIESVLDR
ncbi:MAG: hypothetical protein AAF928_05315 [Myxococcota bacterium]